MKWYEYSAAFVMLYPGVMSVYWTLSGLLYFLLWERRKGKPVFGGDAPMVSILVPCFNEADNLDASIPYLLRLTYPNYELIFINDGSKDDTLSILRRWEAESDKIIALDQKNGGKASAMNHGARCARGKYIVGIDGDAVLDYGALEYIVETLEKRPDIGAVTGNPRVRNRSTILGKLQVAEFSSIIGLIKRSQSLAGTLFTVSGVIMCIRKDVWRQIGGWSENMITDDIDISWKTQLHGYEIMYEPRALCFEYVVTLIWAYLLFAFFFVSIAQAIGGTVDLTPLKLGSLATFIAFLIQLSVSIYIDSRYEGKLLRYFISCIWYPYVFWMINSLTLVHGFPKALLRDKNRKATWTSPDRGIQ